MLDRRQLPVCCLWLYLQLGLAAKDVDVRACLVVDSFVCVALLRGLRPVEELFLVCATHNGTLLFRLHLLLCFNYGLDFYLLFRHSCRFALFASTDAIHLDNFAPDVLQPLLVVVGSFVPHE